MKAYTKKDMAAATRSLDAILFRIEKLTNAPDWLLCRRKPTPWLLTWAA